MAQPYDPSLVRVDHFVNGFAKLSTTFPPAFPLSRRKGPLPKEHGL